MQAAAPLMVAGSLVQGLAGYQSGMYNAAVDKENARQDLREGAVEGEQLRGDARTALGEQVGAQAESGFTPGTGSALESLRQSGINSELDVLQARRKASAAAAANRAKAEMDKRTGQMAALQGLVGAAGAVAGAKGGGIGGRANYAQPASSW